MKNRGAQIKGKYPFIVICRNCGSADGMAKKTSDLSNLICSVCGKTGSSFYAKESKAMKKGKPKWKVEDRVMVDFDGEPFPGTIVSLTKTKAEVLFDDEDVYDIKLSKLQHEGEREDFKPEGFHQYDIQWDKNNINFRFQAGEGSYYGWWRKGPMRNSFAIDLHVKYKDKTYAVESLHYLKEDPREDMQSLEADICTAVNKWFYHKCQSNFDTIEELEQKASKPTIIINKLETIDSIILRLKEYRDTAIRSGGLRVMMFTGDFPDKDPSGEMRIQMDLTKQAQGLKGKTPSLYDGALLDSVAEDSSKKGKRPKRKTEVKSDPSNVKELLKKLGASQDKVEKRKIRGLLRKLGHRGGSRTEVKAVEEKVVKKVAKIEAQGKKVRRVAKKKRGGKKKGARK